MKDKLALYERHKVREYWIIDPIQELVLIYRLTRNGIYGKPDVMARGDMATSRVLRGMQISVTDLLS